jgi:hypothetical protein
LQVPLLQVPLLQVPLLQVPQALERLALLRVQRQVNRLLLVFQQREQQGRRAFLQVLQFLPASPVQAVRVGSLERWALVLRLRTLLLPVFQQPQEQPVLQERRKLLFFRLEPLQREPLLLQVPEEQPSPPYHRRERTASQERMEQRVHMQLSIRNWSASRKWEHPGIRVQRFHSNCCWTMGNRDSANDR